MSKIPEAPDMHKETARQKQSYNKLAETYEKHGLSGTEYSKMNRLHKHYNRKEYDEGQKRSPLSPKEHELPYWDKK